MGIFVMEDNNFIIIISFFVESFKDFNIINEMNWNYWNLFSVTRIINFKNNEYQICYFLCKD